jgi:predicted RNase H-like nuclease (RuvC/YqgF family)
MTEQTVLEQMAYEHYKKVEAENYHLKRQLQNKNKDIKQLKHEVRVWRGKAERQSKKHYRNGKRGTKFNG